MKLYVINGGGRSGKDTFCDFCINEIRKYGITSFQVSSIDQIREVARTLGMGFQKNDKDRQFLSDLKKLSTWYNEGPMLYMEQRMTCQPDDSVIFFHIREPHEIEKFVKRHPETQTILIQRKETEKFTNSSDANVDNFTYDIYIHNEYDLENLQKQAEIFVWLNVFTEDNLVGKIPT